MLPGKWPEPPGEGRPPEIGGADDRRFVTALARGLEVLSCFRSGEKLLGNQDIAMRTGLPKSTVSRLTYTLTALGYLHHVQQKGQYRLGVATLALGSAMLAGLSVRLLARPLMRKLAAQTQAEVALATRDRHSMIYIEHSPSPQTFFSDLDVGTRIPLATTAMGRAWLAACSPAERQQAMDYLKAHAPEQWQVAMAQSSQWPAARGERFPSWVCHSFGDWQPGINAVALAFPPGRGLPLMAVSCGGPSHIVSADFLRLRAQPELERLVHRLHQAVERIG